MPNDEGLTLDQAADVVRRRGYGGTKSEETGSGLRYLGDGLLRCGECRAALVGGHAAGGWYPDPRTASYHCTGCGKVRVPVTVADREVQSLIRRRLSDPSVIARWRTQRLSALDSDLAEIRTVLSWGRDRRRCAQLGRKLGVLTGPGRRAAVQTGIFHLDLMAGQLVGLVAERAALSGEPENDGSRPVGDLKRAHGQLGGLKYPIDALKACMPLGKVIRAVGGRRKYDAHEAEIHELRLALWDLLLGETAWHNPEPAQLPAKDEALTRNWSRSPTQDPSRRRKLLLIALGDDALVAGPAKERGKWIRVV